MQVGKVCYLVQCWCIKDLEWCKVCTATFILHKHSMRPKRSSLEHFQTTYFLPLGRASPSTEELVTRENGERGMKNTYDRSLEHGVSLVQSPFKIGVILMRFADWKTEFWWIGIETTGCVTLLLNSVSCLTNFRLLPNVLSALFPELIRPRVLWTLEEILLHNFVLCGEWEVWCSSLKCSLRLIIAYEGIFSPSKRFINGLFCCPADYAVLMLILCVCGLSWV